MLYTPELATWIIDPDTTATPRESTVVLYVNALPEAAEGFV